MKEDRLCFYHWREGTVKDIKNDTSRMMREYHVRFCERLEGETPSCLLGGKIPLATKALRHEGKSSSIYRNNFHHFLMHRIRKSILKLSDIASFF